MDRISLGPGIVPVDASYKVIEGVGLSQDNELRVGEGECNGLGPLSGWGFPWISWIQREEAAIFGGFFYFLASLRGQCALVQQDLLDYNEPLLWNVIGAFDSSFIFFPSSDVGISPSLVRQCETCDEATPQSGVWSPFRGCPIQLGFQRQSVDAGAQISPIISKFSQYISMVSEWW